MLMPIFGTRLRFPVVICILLTLSTGWSSSPENPVRCTGPGNLNCTITNGYGTFPDRTTCRAGMVAYPTSENDIISIVSNASMSNRKMKVVTRYSHSIPKLVCVDGHDGVLISTRYLNKIVEIDSKAMTATVETGVTLKELIEATASAGLALLYGPYWWGLTVGGMIGTGAHGSSLWGWGSQVHDYVIRLRIVSPARASDGFAKVRQLEIGDPDLDAAKVSLGVLGIISQVTLKLQPLFNRQVTYVTKNDSELGDQVLSFGRKHEFADMTWYPSQKKVVYRIDGRAPENISAHGTYNFLGFRSMPSILLLPQRALEETQELLGDAEGKCLNAKLATSTLATLAYGLTNNGIIFKNYPVIGRQDYIQASGSCLDSPNDGLITVCPWDPRVKGLFFHQTSFSISLSQVKNFIYDVQSLIDLYPKSLCGIEMYNGILMRYVTNSSAYLGKQSDAIDFDFTYYRSQNPQTPRLFENIMEEIEQMGLFKYGGLPHWGKNRNVAFLGAIRKYRNHENFVSAMKKFDPLRLMSSEWTDQVLGFKDGLNILHKGCALEGLCICSKDDHCAPSKGYLCRHGKVYDEARVCEKVQISHGLQDNIA